MRRLLFAVGAAMFFASASQAGTLSSLSLTLGLTYPELCPFVGPQQCNDFDGYSPTLQAGPTGTSAGTSYNVTYGVNAFSQARYTTGGALPIYRKTTLKAGTQNVAGGVGVGVVNQGLKGLVQVNAASCSGVAATPYMHPTCNAVLPTVLVKVPLSIGAAGGAKQTFKIFTQKHNLTVTFFPWTTGMASFGGLTNAMAAIPNVKATGSNGLVGGVGTVTLVAPSKVKVSGALSQQTTASYSKLVMTFVSAPEPSTLLLLGAGLAGLAIVGRKRA